MHRGWGYPSASEKGGEMSDPMTKVEIEDVLSSIRRLVSEDLHLPQTSARRAEASLFDAPRPVFGAGRQPPSRPQLEPQPREDVLDEDFVALRPSPGPEGVAPADAAPDADLPSADTEAEPAAQPDPLVLTPQLRVAEADSASLRASLEETIAELEAAVSGAGGEWEPDGSEGPLDPTDFSDLAGGLATRADAEGLGGGAAEPAADMDAAAGEDSTKESDAQDLAHVRLVSDTGDAWPEGVWSQYPETMEWSAPGDEAEDSVADSGAEVGAGGDLPIEALGSETAGFEGLDLAPEEPEGTAVDAVDAGDAAAEDDADADVADRFWAAEAEDEATAADPVFIETDLSGSAAPDWQDDAPETGRPRRLHLAGGLGWGATPPISAAGRGWIPSEPDDSDLLEAEEDEDGLFDDVEDAVLDEAALRALVSEIIRQELQGTLGERITRSVRKLVRREIQRALASRDFE